MRTHSLRSRLIIGMLLGMALLLGAAGTVVFAIQRREHYRAFDTSLLTTANSVALAVRPSRLGDWFNLEGLDRLPEGQVRPGALFQLWSEKLIAVLSTQSTDHAPDDDDGPDDPPPRDRPPPDRDFPDEPRGPRFRGPLDPPERRISHAPRVYMIRSPSLGGADLPRMDVPVGQARYQDLALPGGQRGRAVTTLIQLPGPPPGPSPRPPPRPKVTVVVAAETAAIEKQLSFLGALLVLTALGTLAVSGAVAWLVVSRGLHPLATVAGRISALDEKALKQRLPERDLPLEIEPVVKQLNGLLSRLDAAFERERGLTADVAHELRTPIAEIRAIAEITLNRLREPREYQAAFAEALDAVRSLQDMVERLLVLARLEAGQTPSELKPTIVRSLLATHWTRAANGTAERGVVFENGCDSNFKVSADPRLLDVVLSNVLTNAAAYTPDGGRITAESHSDGAARRLSIANTGCQLTNEQIARAFDRFWRGDSARSNTGLNCGLGLTLVRRAMEAMGGQVTARVSHDRRFIMDLIFVPPPTD